MAKLNQIKGKIRSVGNLKKITRALEVVSTVKLQKIKAQAEWLKHYLVELLWILSQVNEQYDIFEETGNKESDRELIIIITSERGLCGWLNSKLLRKMFDDQRDDTKTEAQRDYFVIWKKWLEFIKRMGWNIVWSLELDDGFDEDMILPLYSYFDTALSESSYQNINLYFNYFKNAMAQIPTSIQLFPFAKKDFEKFLDETDIQRKSGSVLWNKELIVEPSLQWFFGEVRRQIRNYLIASAVVQNKAWEHAARMIAMKNAKENAESFVDELTLSFNKARQWAITQEISEIVSAKLAIEG